MDKFSFNLNESLRFLLAGGVAILSYFFLYPCELSRFINDREFSDSLFLIFIDFVFGALIYTLHRALLYPLYLKFLYSILSQTVKGDFKWDSGFKNPIVPSKTEIDEDFRRWGERREEKSFSKDLIQWGSQVHFLYCSSLSILLTIFFSLYIKGYKSDRLFYLWIFFGVILLAGLIYHLRLLIYDKQTGDREEKLLIKKANK